MASGRGPPSTHAPAELGLHTSPGDCSSSSTGQYPSSVAEVVGAPLPHHTPHSAPAAPPPFPWPAAPWLRAPARGVAEVTKALLMPGVCLVGLGCAGV